MHGGISVRKRSTYRPKRNLQDPLSFVLNGFMPADQKSNGIIQTVRIMNHGAINAVRTGKATWEDVSTIVVAMNVGLGLCAAGVGEDYAYELRQALKAALALEQKDKWLLTGPELNAINHGMAIHDGQLDICTVADMEASLVTVQQMIAERKQAVRRQACFQ